MAEETNTPAAELVTAVVWSDGTNVTIFYDWQDGAQMPNLDWERAGDLFVVPNESEAGWTACANVAEPRWEGVMKQAIPHFEATVRELISKLNAQGFGLQDLDAVLAVGKDSPDA